MADGNDGGGTSVLAFLVGGLLVLVIGIFAFGWFNHNDTATLRVEVPSIAVDRAPAPAGSPTNR